MKKLKQLFSHQRAKALAVFPALALMAGGAQAALPGVENPTRGTGNGLMATLQNYGYDIIMLLALAVCAVMFLGVSYHAYNVYGEVQTGRKTWGSFGATVGVGAILLVIGIWLLTSASGVL